MKRKTHIRVGLIPVAFAYVLMPIKPPMFIVIALGIASTVLPDFDIIFGLKHRGITHSLAFAIALSVLVGGVLGFPSGLIWLVGYSSHIFLDSLTKMGVPMLYPVSSKMYGVRKLKTGGKLDNWILLYGIFFGGLGAILYLAHLLHIVVT
ncbi:MAG: metal-dependent hydrolase [Sarcina sp.]